jgi:hypothetical protein
MCGEARLYRGAIPTVVLVGDHGDLRLELAREFLGPVVGAIGDDGHGHFINGCLPHDLVASRKAPLHDALNRLLLIICRYDDVEGHR